MICFVGFNFLFYKLELYQPISFQMEIYQTLTINYVLGKENVMTSIAEYMILLKDKVIYV